MGTPEFAAPSLRKLAEIVQIEAVAAQPDRPRGRGQKPLPPPVKTEAERLGIPVLQPERAKERAFAEQLRALEPDICAVAAYGQLLPTEILNIPRFGCVNLHPSALPKYRGAAPIQRALWNGETETAAAVIQLNEEEDAGPILAQRRVPIEPRDTAVELSAKLAAIGAELLAETVAAYPNNPPKQTPQNHALATKAPKMERGMGDIDWTLPARQIYNRYRACAAWPRSRTALPNGEQLLIADCRPVQPDHENGALPPGAVLPNNRRLVVQCGGGALEILRLKPENRRETAAADYLNGLQGSPPERFRLPERVS